ncbi:hypothetical protein KJ682_05255 [bacterium]|nr:hypothetical protein [bacterium]
MRRLLIPVLALSVICLAPGAFAAVKTSADVVKAAPAAATVTAKAGQRVDFTIKVDIDHTWHLYAHGDTNFLGIDLVPDEFFPLQDFQAAYPEGKAKKFFGEMVLMIEGSQVIKASALVPAGMQAGEQPLDLVVAVQACDDKTCLQPARIPVSLTLKVE